jgi:hypothetical protein
MLEGKYPFPNFIHISVSKLFNIAINNNHMVNHQLHKGPNLLQLYKTQNSYKTTLQW